MEKELEELYNLLAQKMVSMIPTDWNKIYYLGEVEKEQASWSSVFYFEESDSEIMTKSHIIPEKYNVSEEIYDELLSELNSILLRINDCFEKNNRPVWDQLSFSLTSDGKFGVDFLYDRILADDGGQIQRELVWAYETFNHMPKEGTYGRELLDSYLKEK